MNALVLAAVLTWTHPTTGIQDGNTVPLPLSLIASSTVEWSNGTTFGAVSGTQSVPAPAATVTLPDPLPGTSRCYRVRTVTTAGQTSGPSNVDCKAVPAGPIQPNPPSLLSVILAWLRGFFGRFV